MEGEGEGRREVERDRGGQLKEKGEKRNVGCGKVRKTKIEKREIEEMKD